MRRVIWLTGLAVLLASCRAVEDKPLPPPFQLAANQEKNVNRLLDRWDQWNATTKAFKCRFKHWKYDSVFGPPDRPMRIDNGTIEYAASGRGKYQVDSIEENGQPRVSTDKGLVLSPASDAKAGVGLNISDPIAVSSPLLRVDVNNSAITLFHPLKGKIAELKRLYYFREITPADAKDEIWLEAFPRSTHVAMWTQEVQLIFHTRDMSPKAIKIVAPGGRSRDVYLFFDAS
jgi:hypothetical protein